MSAKIAKWPEKWKQLKPKQHKVIRNMVQLHQLYGRWPTASQLAETTGYTVASVAGIIRQLIQKRFISNDNSERGMPPSYVVHGFKVVIVPE